MESTFEWKPLSCSNCGVFFSIPAHLAYSIATANRSVWCPNGHENRFTDARKEIDATNARAENARLKDQLVQLRHDLEMAEARKEKSE
jgi:hypothetical protein